MGNSDSLTNLLEFRFLISISCPDTIGTSVRVSRAAPFGFPCVSPLLPRKPTCRLWQFSSGQVFQPSPSDHRVGNFNQVTRLRIGSLSLQPAGLLDSLNEPLSGNSTLRVTPCASLKLRGELPNSHGWTLTNKSYGIHGIRSHLDIGRAQQRVAHSN